MLGLDKMHLARIEKKFFHSELAEESSVQKPVLKIPPQSPHEKDVNEHRAFRIIKLRAEYYLYIKQAHPY